MYTINYRITVSIILGAIIFIPIMYIFSAIAHFNILGVFGVAASYVLIVWCIYQGSKSGQNPNKTGWMTWKDTGQIKIYKEEEIDQKK